MKNKKIPEIVSYRRDIEVITSGFDSFPEHRHEFYEFEYVSEGAGEYILNGQSFNLKKGDLVFVTPMDLHSYKKGNEKFRTITVKFVPERLCHQLRDITKFEPFIMTCDDNLKNAFLNIKNERSSEKFTDFAIKNALERILILILREKVNASKADKELDLGQIIGYINKNFRNTITLDEVSEKCGYSNSHFCRQFKKTTGKSFVEYLNNIRVIHAKNLLATTDMSITDISYDCGFGSVRNLNREFLKRCGCSPNEYRKSKNIL